MSVVILIPPIEVMVNVVENFIYQKTNLRIKIIFNDPINVHRHIEMLKDLYKLINKHEEWG